MVGEGRLNRLKRASVGLPGYVMVAGILIASASTLAAAETAKGAQSTNPEKPSPRTVFQAFAESSLERTYMRPILKLFEKKRYGDAERALRALAKKYPASPLYRYNLGAALARQGKKADALASLDKAIDLGFLNRRAAERDPDFAVLHGDPEFIRLMDKLEAAVQRRGAQARARAAVGEVTGRRARVEEANSASAYGGAVLASRFRFPPKAASTTVHTAKKPFARSLNALFKAGKAAGNHGDLYDNRDRGHSRFGRGGMPQVSHIEYGEGAAAVGLDYGVNPGLLFNAITFGNSSTAISHQLVWRSQARLILTTPNLTTASLLQYLNNHVYMYPEHSDHDRGRGDLMPANTPYMIVSQGSSGSDQPFMEAVSVILAAFRPETKALLRQRRLIAPTVQMVLRRGQKSVKTDADYLTGRAHPSVFSGKEIDLPALVDLANGLAPDAVPPMVHLNVLEEDKAQSGADFFAPPGMSETLFNTPGAIARLVRSSRYWHRIVVSAERTVDPNGHPLRFRWVVLRGDADRIRIRPLDDAGTKAEIRMPWHDRQPGSDNGGLASDRVDIGVFADNGKSLSAPAFVTFLFPGDQKRSYDATGRLKCIDYDHQDYRKRYVDPLIFPKRDWRDCYDYDESGALVGWNRIRGGSLQRFTANGHKVIEKDAQGRPLRAQRVRYRLEVSKTKRAKAVPDLTDEVIRYRYRDARDRVGVGRAVAQ